MTSLNNYSIEELENLKYAVQERLLLVKKKEEENEEGKEIKKNDPIKCKICGGKYTRSNKSFHEKTARHKRELEHLIFVTRIAKSKTFLGRVGPQ